MKKRVNPTKHPFRIGLLAVMLLIAQLNFASEKEAKGAIPTPASTQQRKVTEVTGTVSDSSGPIIGASVVIKGTGTGVITNLDGEFKLMVPEGATLVISYMGYQNKEIVYKGERTLKISLDENVQQLEEVQIIAYGTTKKATITGAMSSIGSNEILKAPVGNIANALSGKVTGFSSVQSTGQPGADDPQVYVRGVGSLSTDLSAPLMLVDGVERSFYRLDPNEIEDITILKDASATAVFGVRGANGVILVTTKRGQEGKAKLSFTTSFAVQMPTHFAKIANSYEHAMAFNAAQLNDNPDAKLAFSDEMIEAFRTGSNPLLYPDTDWVDMIIKNAAFQSQHNFNISGGSKNVRYFASLGVFTQEGLFKTFDKDYNANFNYNRYNYRINMDIDLTKTTSVKVNVGGRLDDRRTPNYNNGTYTDLKYLFRDIYWSAPFAGAGIVDGKRVVANSKTFASVGNVSDALNSYHGKGYSTIDGNTLNFDFILDQKLDIITKGLKIHVKGSYNSGVTQTKRFEGRDAIYEAWQRDTEGPNGEPIGEMYLKKTGEKTNLGTYKESYDMARDWYLEGALNYRRDFGLHHVSAMAMYNQSMRYYPKGSWPGIPRSYVGLVGRITYDYNTRYLLDLSIGYNGSENFAPGKRFGTFPAGSLGWIISEEKFWESVRPYVNYFKIRGSYGIVGNDRVSDNSRFLYLPDSYTISTGAYSFGTSTSAKIPGAREAKKGNPDVTWETATKQNYGVDLHFLDSKLKATFDYFVEHRKDILRSRTISPGYLAVALPTANIGKVDNKGFEVSLRWEDNAGDFRYFIDANLSYAKSKIVFMDEIQYPHEWMQATGRPVGQRFGYVFDGYFTEEDVERYKNGQMPDQGFNPKPGDVKYKDLNGDEKIDDKDRKAIGYPIYPLLTGGVSLGFSYKGFDLNMTWAGAGKTSRLVAGIYREPFGSSNTSSLWKYMIDDAWTPEKGDAAKAPKLSFASKSNNYQDSDLWLRDASYLRLKNIELGYSLPQSLLKKANLSQCRVFVSGYNLLTFDKLKISDPEADPSQSVEYPVIKVVNFGLRFGF